MIKHVYGSTELCKKFNRYWVALNECVTIFIRVGIWLLTKTGQILIILTLQIYRLNTANGCMLSTIHFRVTFSQYRPSEHMFRATPRMAYCPPPFIPPPCPRNRQIITLLRLTQGTRAPGALSDRRDPLICTGFSPPLVGSAFSNCMDAATAWRSPDRTLFLLRNALDVWQCEHVFTYVCPSTRFALQNLHAVQRRNTLDGFATQQKSEICSRSDVTQQ